MKYQVYGIKNNNQFEWKVTSNIETDLKYWYEKGINELLLLSPLISVGHALSFLQQNDEIPAAVERLKTLPGFQEYRQIYHSWKNEFHTDFHGKNLLLDEVVQRLQHKGASDQEEMKMSILMQTGYLLDEIKIASGVTYPESKEKAHHLICHRCGSENQVHIQKCERCKENCATCEACITMGRSKTCSPLMEFSFYEEKEHLIACLSYGQTALIDPLSPYQKEIADQTVRFLEEGKTKEMLIWAVTGAGKTEMIFPSIRTALNLNQKILLASPRKDVIKELTPRFKKAFPEMSIVSLYGGSNEKWDRGEIYLATTHQTMRFSRFFDLVVIDEMDAFPYHNSPMLQYVVKRALKENGKMIYLTATPKPEWQEKIKAKKIDYSVLPIRYHQKPLPVPQIEIIRSNPHPKLQRFLHQVKKENGQAFIFVASVKEVGALTGKMKTWFPDDSIAGIFANDPDRDEKTKDFRNGNIQFLITTTIMERGVTVPNVHVLVFGAEHKVFDEAALVQIAGRAGRSGAYPTGLVYFFAKTFTKDMIKAVKQIERMNRLAEKLIKNSQKNRRSE